MIKWLQVSIIVALIAGVILFVPPEMGDVTFAAIAMLLVWLWKSL